MYLFLGIGGLASLMDILDRCALCSICGETIQTMLMAGMMKIVKFHTDSSVK